ncbi:MAG: zinc ribbon domain-containing protein [Bryobacteraceae bacterium]
MPEFCTCGAQLPPDALFCHKCGKPQREIPGVAPAEEVTDRIEIHLPPPVFQAATPPRVDFRNPVAVRIALLLAVGATVLTAFLPFLNWLAAGFFAVWFYRRKTGARMNVGAGVRLGWITGILTFGLASVVFALEQVPAAINGQLANTIRQQLHNLPIQQDPAVTRQVSELLASSSGIVFFLVFTLAGLFLMITCLSMAGGALGAKLTGRS